MNALISPAVEKSAKPSISQTHLARIPKTSCRICYRKGFPIPPSPHPEPMGKLRVLAGAWESTVWVQRGPGVGVKSKALSIAPD